MLEPNLYHLKYFVDAATLNSVGAAAKKNSVSQPAVSQGIKKLEEALGVELLVHNKNRFKLSHEGELVLVKFKEILSVFQNLRDELTEKQEEVSGQVSLGTMRSLALHFLPRIFKELKEQYPKLTPVMKIAMSKVVAEQVKRGQIELGLVSDDSNLDGLQAELVYEGAFRCVLGAEHKSQASHLGFLVTEERPGLLEIQKFYKKKHKKEADITMVIQSWEVITRMALEGLGIGVIPDFIANSYRQGEFIYLYPDFAPKYRIYLIHCGRKQLSRHAKIVLDQFSATVFDAR